MVESKEPSKVPKKNRNYTIIISLILILCIVVGLLYYNNLTNVPKNVEDFNTKVQILEKEILSDENQEVIGKSPANDEANQVVFISICNTVSKTKVFKASADNLNDAFKNAVEETRDYLKTNNFEAAWVKANVVSEYEAISRKDLGKEIKDTRENYYRHGIAFDNHYDLALLEAEINSNRIYDYDDGKIDLDNLNTYLKEANRSTIKEIPDKLTSFRTYGYFVDETNNYYPLKHKGTSYGRRYDETISKEDCMNIIRNAVSFLQEQVKEDGSFVYGLLPRINKEIDDYNMLRHAGTVWSMICKYKLEPDEELAKDIKRSIDYLVSQIIWH